MRKVLTAVPLLLVMVGGCDSGRRDFTYCDQTYSDCQYGFTCDFTAGKCVQQTDAAVPPNKPDAADANNADASDAVSGEDGAPDAPPPVDVALPDAPAVDVSIVVDAFVPVDLPLPDLRVPDAPGTCFVDNDCVGVPGGAYCLNEKCVACKSNSQCNNDAGAPICSAANTCVSCASTSSPDGGSGCMAATVCEATSGRCVQCVSNSDCPTAGKAFCVQNLCVGCDKVPTGGVDGGVDGGAHDGGAADGGAGTVCSAARPICVPSTPAIAIAGQCVQCLTGANCGGATPVCDGSNTCVHCTSDSQCMNVGPGVCMSHDNGRCATDAETIYVQNSASCDPNPSDIGAGSPDRPLCNSQDAFTLVTPSRRVIVMSLTNLTAITATATTSAGKITIIGQGGAATGTGGPIRVHVTSGDIFIRGLTITGGLSAGVVVESGATLRMDGCTVKGNAGGGLVVQSGANFDIANSIFDGNGPGQINTTTTFGGVYLGGGAPATGPSRFWFSTVVNNQDRGVICFDTAQALSGMLLRSNTNGDYLSCTLDNTSLWASGKTAPDNTTSYSGDLTLDSTDRLTASDHCRGFLALSTPHPPDDIDGNARPKGTNTKISCGADEF